MRRIRCAIYTRKSSEDGLEQDFNSLDAQREACKAYIASQKHEGWELLSDHYDDGGISGGNLDRPALHRLMRAVDDKQVDQIVVYKIDRLTRSLNDFAKLVERLDAVEASFVSVTQSFNTATSMGRLTLNVLLSFAQFEREVTAERIRDKIAASKKKGLWMGGNEPLGYTADGRTLRVIKGEAETIRFIYQLYMKHRTIRGTAERTAAVGLRSRRREWANGRVSGGTPLDRGHIHYILSNPVYAGRIRHKGNVYEGQHPPIIDPTTWDKVQEMLKDGSARTRGHEPKAFNSPLAGKLFDETGDRLTPSHSRKNGKRLRYYISRRLVTDRCNKHPEAWRLPADQIENLVYNVVEQHLSEPDVVARASKDLDAIAINTASERLAAIGSRTELLALIHRVDLRQGSITVRLAQKALAKLIGCGEEQIDAGKLTVEAPFQKRRRGVELKLYLGSPPPEIDRNLVKNIVNARRWLEMLIEGQSYAQIAAAENISNRRVQSHINFALLSPKILDAIASGTHPDGLTIDYLIQNGIPAVWSDQKTQLVSRSDQA